MTLGKYINTNSLIHKLDPRNKFLLLVLFMVIIFVNNTYIGYGFLLILSIVLFKIAKLKLKLVFQSLKMIWMMMIFLFIFNLFVYKSGNLLVKFWIFEIYDGAIIQTLKIVLRLYLLISFSTLFTSTTKPLDITLAIDDIFAFLKIFKINVHIFSMIISIALRFIPTILDDTYRIMNAQASRGVDYKNGKFKEKLVAISSLIVPLIISSFSRSDELANAMEARNYDPYATRTRYRNLKWAFKDSLCLLLSLLLLGLIIFIQVYFKEPDLNLITTNFIRGLF